MGIFLNLDLNLNLRARARKQQQISHSKLNFIGYSAFHNLSVGMILCSFDLTALVFEVNDLNTRTGRTGQ